MVKRIVYLVLVAIAGYIGWQFWLELQPSPLPDYIASGNGRIEATEYDIATKRAGRVSDVRVNEGDSVTAGQILARMDTDDLQAQYREAQAQLTEARESRAHAEAVVAQRKSELAYAEAEYRRSQTLVEKGHVSREQVDQHRTAKLSAEAALRAATVNVRRAEAAIAAAQARTERLQTEIEDSVLVTPVAGRVLYRLAEPGEVLAAGGKVVTVLELTDVYMTLFLPMAAAGRLSLGSEARIILDAIPQYVIPAKVTFVAARAQFTPREVETRSEREKLMFRVKVNIDPQLLRRHDEKVKTGVPGEAYVKLDDDKDWPESLQVKLPAES